MMDFIVMAALAAVLSYGAMSAYDQPYHKLEAALSSTDADWLPSGRDGARTGTDRSATRSGQPVRFALETRASVETAVLAGVPQLDSERR
jgi:hypothetical protein